MFAIMRKRETKTRMYEIMSREKTKRERKGKVTFTIDINIVESTSHVDDALFAGFKRDQRAICETACKDTCDTHVNGVCSAHTYAHRECNHDSRVYGAHHRK